MSSPATASSYEIEYNAIAEGIAEGKVVPFLGAGFNLGDRPPDAHWEPGKSIFLPSGAELSDHLATRFKYPLADRDLARVCQFIVEVRGLAPLYEHLRSLFNVRCDVTRSHRFLAKLPGRLRDKKYPTPYPLIVTTNYDDLVESAFSEAAEPLEVVSYVADAKGTKGRFAHHIGGERRVIARPNEYREVSLTRSSVLLKIHGALDRLVESNDSFVITEDHYIDFLSRTDLSNLIPVTLHAHLRESHFLFLGYSLRDWNLRVILQRIWEEQRLGYNSWAVQKRSDALDRRFWSRRNVEILETELGNCVTAIEERLANLPEFQL